MDKKDTQNAEDQPQKSAAGRFMWSTRNINPEPGPAYQALLNRKRESVQPLEPDPKADNPD